MWRTIGASIALVLAASTLAQNTYPSRPITMLVGFAPSGGPAMADLLGGQILSAFASAPSAVPQVKAGKIRALARHMEREFRVWGRVVKEAGIRTE